MTEPILTPKHSYKMFEPNMDDYLDDEIEELKRAFQVICKDWERSVSLTASSMVRIRIHPQPCNVRFSWPSSLCLLRAIGHGQRSCAPPNTITSPE